MRVVPGFESDYQRYVETHITKDTGLDLRYDGYRRLLPLIYLQLPNEHWQTNFRFSESDINQIFTVIEQACLSSSSPVC
jgi:hypothetical protein